jgi:3-(methylthio)propanoyl-CoA dehydrogenase
MSEYVAPLRDLKFALEELADLEGVRALPGYEEATPDLVDAVLAEAAKVAHDVLSPLNHSGDMQGARLGENGVETADGWKEAYQLFVDGGWNSLSFSPEWGGQGLPWLVSTAVQEMYKAANLSFDLCPLLTQAAVEAISAHGSDEQKRQYLEKLVSGQWTGTMNLTEPQAGSDLAAVKTLATQDGDVYRIKGQKIFITYGDHDMTENIIHLVLAKVPGAPEGVKGISLFIVPKFILDDQGNPGERNDVHCVSIEKKMGIHASPTCVLAYGDNEGAIGYLVGEENRGLEYMFTMMNLARHAVGVEGYAIAERAYQKALSYAKDRVQGRDPKTPSERVAIIAHPDVRRMLMDMKVQIEAMRGLGCIAASATDKMTHSENDIERAKGRLYVDMLTPVVKGWSTEVGNELTYTGVQIHGGMGFMEATGAAQYSRDARITTIYEGTTGIQANDIAGRKLLRDGGLLAKGMLAVMKEDIDRLVTIDSDKSRQIVAAMHSALSELGRSVDKILEMGKNDPSEAMGVSVPYLMQFGYVTGGWIMAKSFYAASQKVAEQNTDLFYADKMFSALYYIQQILPLASSYSERVCAGGNMMVAANNDWFDRAY